MLLWRPLQVPRPLAEQIRIDIVVGTRDRHVGNRAKPAMEIEAVEVHEIWRTGADRSAQTLREGPAVVLVIGVDSPAHDAAQMIPDLAMDRVLAGNWRRFRDEADIALQCFPRLIERQTIRLMLAAIESHEIDVILLL